MLNFIKIKNYALIESSELEFAPGFNVFTGESGAGKSILLGAVDLLLGGRADRGAIRNGCAKAEVSGCFSVPGYLADEVNTLLSSADIPFDSDSGELCVRRVITQSSTRNYINDTPVSAKLLSDTGSLLIDRHRAGEQLSLLQTSRQLELLDRYGNLLAERAQCASAARALAELEQEIKSFESTLPDESEADHLSLIVEEIERVNPAPGEDEELAAKHSLASNSQQILSAAGELSVRLYDGENSIADQLGAICRQLSDLEKFDEKSISPLVSKCVEMQDLASDLAREVTALADHIELDPAEFAALEERMAELHTLKRRYAPSIELLLETLERAKVRLDDFKRASVKRGEFVKRRQELLNQQNEICRTLSKHRKACADALAKELLSRLDMIGFANARIVPEFSETENSSTGCDHFELHFSANPGEALRPLRKIASSGELSRIMLAFKVVLADSDAVPTVIFDEIDMNIGGETANKVGNALKLLSKKRQILSISHLPQVASQADKHFLVKKTVSDGRTYSSVEELSDTRQELDRMIGFIRS